MSQDNIFHEVDEELRRDRMRGLWRRLAPFVFGAAIAVVAAVAINEGWTWYHSNNAAQSSDELYAAFGDIDGGDLAAAETQLEALAANGSGSYPVLAEFRRAGVLARDGKSAEAVAAFDALANDQSNPILRELALVQAGTLLVDAGTLADVESRVGSIATEGGAMRNAAHEALGLAHYKAGDLEAARTEFQAVLDDNLAPSTVRNRMSFYLAQLASQGLAAAPEALDAERAAETIDNLVSGDEGAAPTGQDAPAADTAPTASTTEPAPTAP